MNKERLSDEVLDNAISAFEVTLEIFGSSISALDKTVLTFLKELKEYRIQYGKQE